MGLFVLSLSLSRTPLFNIRRIYSSLISATVTNRHGRATGRVLYRALGVKSCGKIPCFFERDLPIIFVKRWEFYIEKNKIYIYIIDSFVKKKINLHLHTDLFYNNRGNLILMGLVSCNCWLYSHRLDVNQRILDPYIARVFRISYYVKYYKTCVM